MRRTERSVRLPVAPSAAFGACLALLENPDPRRGIVARVCRPSPPRVGAEVVSTVVRNGVEVLLRSRVVTLDRPRELATHADQTPRVRTTLTVVPDGQGDGAGSLVTLVSEVEAGLADGRKGSFLDGLLYRRAQRRSAVATLRRLCELAETG